MTPARSTSIHIMASVCLPSAGSSSIPQRAAEVPIGPANATWWGASTAVTSWLRRRVSPSIAFARCSTREPGSTGPPPRTQPSTTVGAHSGQRPTSQIYAHTSWTLLAIVMRLSVLIVMGGRCVDHFPGCVRSPATLHHLGTTALLRPDPGTGRAHPTRGWFKRDRWSYQGGCSLRAAQACCARGRSVRSLSLVWSVPSRAGSTSAVVRRPVAGAGDARRPASLRARRRGQPDRREGSVDRGGCHRRWSRALRAARRRRQL